MFYTLQINIGGRIHDRFFCEFENVAREYNKEILDRVKSGWTIKENVNRFDVAKGQQHIYVTGHTDKGEEYSIFIFDTYFEDEPKSEKLTEEKIGWLTEHHHNLFQAGLIQRAISDENISVEKFAEGYKEIERSEERDEDEFAPDWFKED